MPLITDLCNRMQKYGPSTEGTPRGKTDTSHGAVRFAAGGLPSRPQREVAPDPARLERAATLDDCGLERTLTG
jgi:hypothetical protein